jgi:hypothetical protein
MNQTEDLDGKVCEVNVGEEANGCVIRNACSRRKAGAIDNWRRDDSEVPRCSGLFQMPIAA